MAKFSLRNFRRPTPKKIKRFGNAVFLASQGAAALALVGEERWLAIGLTVAGFLGKLLSEFFDTSPSSKQP